MRNKRIVVCMVLWLILIMPITVFAQTFDMKQTGSISVALTEQQVPITGVELSVYYVAKAEQNSDGKLFYTYTDAFEACGAPLDDPTLCEKLDTFISDQVSLLYTQITDFNGEAVFSDLPLGLYLVKQTAPAKNGFICAAFLVTVPYETAEGYIYDVDAMPKTDIGKITDITVKKVWNTDTKDKIPGSVTVWLLKNEDVIKTAVLTPDNDWQITFTDMPENDAYSVMEENVPEGFTATYEQNGYVFTVTNSASLPQTGQIVWPIPFLAAVGLLLMTVGTVLLRRSRSSHA